MRLSQILSKDGVKLGSSFKPGEVQWVSPLGALSAEDVRNSVSYYMPNLQVLLLAMVLANMILMVPLCVALCTDL
jgi:hypothetical protein